MDHYQHFIELLSKEDKAGAITYAVGLLHDGDTDVISLYEGVLGPSLRNMTCGLKERRWCIWKEHMRTSIVRTIVECCTPYVMSERKERYRSTDRGKAVLVCPTEEYHEIGLRMVADMFTLSGYDVALVGANTPDADIVSAVEYFRPTVLGISASSSYSLFSTARIIKMIREDPATKGVKIVVGGGAFEPNPQAWKEIGADACLMSFKDIQAFEGR